MTMKRAIHRPNSLKLRQPQTAKSELQTNKGLVYISIIPEIPCCMTLAIEVILRSLTLYARQHLLLGCPKVAVTAKRHLQDIHWEGGCIIEGLMLWLKRKIEKLGKPKEA
jgi:hypothetical protein